MSESPSTLASSALTFGDPARGAIIFHSVTLGCSKCHSTNERIDNVLGPNLAKLDKATTDSSIVDSVLRPSKEIRKGYEAATVLLVSGQTQTGIIVKNTPAEVVIKASDGKEQRFAGDDVDSVVASKVSIMPKGQVATLRDRQEFLDLVRYLIDIRDGGVERAEQLQPSPAQLMLKLPEYEANVDHAGILTGLDVSAFNRGKEVYQSLCINCHGTLQKPGSLPTAIRFGEGKFKRGSDPLSMYRTLTHGFGLMLPQPWMVPVQKYDVVHYIREEFLKPHNSSQYFDVTDSYLASLPKGDTRGPAPRRFEPWANMDYGPYLINTYEIGTGLKNIAQKGIAIQLDSGVGGIGHGSTWSVFDHDTMRLAGGWSGQDFIDWKGIHFNGNHGVHPRAASRVIINNVDGPGWADPATDEFADDKRVEGRDGRRFGPLPRQWAKYHGLYRNGRRTVVSYSVGTTSVLEQFSMLRLDADNADQSPLIARTMNIGPRNKPMTLLVTSHVADSPKLEIDGRIASLSVSGSTTAKKHELLWDGNLYGQVDDDDSFEMHEKDFTIVATIKTRRGGTILSKTTPDSDWVPGGRTFFVRGGRLGFDIGWVGVVHSEKPVANGKPWQVAVVWDANEKTATLFVNGKASGRKKLAGKVPPKDTAVRVGYTTVNFPSAENGFDGDLSDVRFYQQALDMRQLKNIDSVGDENLVANWPLEKIVGSAMEDTAGDHHLSVESVMSAEETGTLVAGMSHEIEGVEWIQRDQKLCLHIPEGDQPLRFVVWSGILSNKNDNQIDGPHIDQQMASDLDLSKELNGGPPLWPEKIETVAERGADDGPFAVDTLTWPKSNPWLARTRFTGLDFFDDTDSMAVCGWDGDVWLVTGLRQLESQKQAKLTWRRIASGLFQPLGLKIVDGKIFVNCRDQIVILNDLNGDGETDFYQCFNDDHQVTEHFHEFAMGLQRDDIGNFYYAKSARHALKALVPHHGTLLRVSPDGKKTDILAVGFRAANGVCLNPDGSFIVTDQEGHWNPKNRINWVKPGGFYGNIFGYHDITDESDAAMDQPLCWITNAFDRSPAELLWVDTEKWGPLNGKLLNLSYGYGKVYVVPHEFIDGQPQGGMCKLPIDQFPTGTMRGRFSPHDGQLYVCGMFAWGSAQQTEEGGLYRLRYTGKKSYLPVGIKAREGVLELELTDAVDSEFSSNADHYQVKMWSLKRSANYGSKHYDERELKVNEATIGPDGRRIALAIPDLDPTWCMEVVYQVKLADGTVEERVIHNTIHAIGK